MQSADRRLVGEAVLELAIARLRTLLPFRVLARQLGGVTPAIPEPVTVTPSSERKVIAHRIGWAIRATSPWLPFRTLCLQQAVAGRAMLARRGIGSVLHLGVDRSKLETLSAHAWLDTDGVAVTGYPVDPALVEVARFA